MDHPKDDYDRCGSHRGRSGVARRKRRSGEYGRGRCLLPHVPTIGCNFIENCSSTKEGLMSNSVRRKTKVETPPMVSKTRRTQRRPIEARLQGHPLRVNAADLARRQFLHLAAGAAALPALSRDASVQTYPTRPITMIVPVAAGSNSDSVGRIITERMREKLAAPAIPGQIRGSSTSRNARQRPAPLIWAASI